MRNQSGQGTVEYILILVVVVAVILGSVLQFNKSFADFGNAYFGDYLDCLIELGELPSLGGGAGASAGCNAQFQAFTLSEGRPANENSRGSGGKGLTDANKDKDRQNRDRGKAEKGRAASSAGVRTAGRSRGKRFSARRGKTSGFAKSQAGGEKKGGLEAAGGTEDATFLRNDGKSKSIKIKRKESFVSAREKEEEKNKKLQIKVKSKEQAAARDKLIKVRRKIAQAKITEDEPLTFGQFFRFLIIAAIIIALVVVIGSQVLKLTKELD